MKVSDSDWAAWEDTRLTASRWAGATARLADARNELAQVANSDPGEITRCEAAVAAAQAEAEAGEHALFALFDRLWRWTVQMAGGSEDAAQDGWAKVRKHCKKFWGENSSPAFLATVMRNARLDEIRRDNRIGRRHAALAAQVPLRPPVQSNAELTAMAQQLLGALPERESHVFQLSARGHSVSEIAEMLGTTEARAATVLNRARRMLHADPTARRVPGVRARSLSNHVQKRGSQ